jgi:hypothetical protein
MDGAAHPSEEIPLPEQPQQLLLARRLAGLFAELEQVEAVALGGSLAAGTADAASDIDLYVYTRAEVPLAARVEIVRRSGGANQADLGLDYWGPGDEWYYAPNGTEVDVVYFDAAWMEAQMEKVLDLHIPSQSYTTCFWGTVLHSLVLFDRGGWLARLQSRASIPYPEALRTNIIALNYPLLRGVIPAYANQLEKAAWRGDVVGINHRLTALLASYFDILFALNRQPHPGEKRLRERAEALCLRLPENFGEQLSGVLLATGALEELPARVRSLLDSLDALLEEEGFDLAALAERRPQPQSGAHNQFL